ncbi:hypothetical protein EC988_006338, partial [Linderina pennispora]
IAVALRTCPRCCSGSHGACGCPMVWCWHGGRHVRGWHVRGHVWQPRRDNAHRAWAWRHSGGVDQRRHHPGPLRHDRSRPAIRWLHLLL